MNANTHELSCSSQAIYVLQTQGLVYSGEILRVLSGPALPVTSIYDVLGLRFIHDGRIYTCPIDKGRFTIYQRHEWPGMPYEGSYRADQLAALIPDA